ncbi:MAG: gamma-glutamyltransferase, partial [Rhodospirillaceae bacterium]
TYRDLQAFLPQWRQAIEVIYSPRTSFFIPLPRTPVGTMAAKALAVAVHDSQFQKADDPLRAHLLAEAIQRALVDGGRGFATVAPVRENRLDYEPEEPRVRLSAAYIEGLSKSIIADRVVRLAAGQASQPPRSSVGGQTSFTVGDRTGNAVACFVTMNRDFGVGTPVRGTGVHLAAPVASTDQRDLSAALLMLARRDKDLLYMAASASGGNTAQAALIQAALRAAGDTPDDMDTAVKWSRLYRDPAAVVTYVEEGAPASIVNGLRQRGHEVRTIAPFGRVNMMFCGTGLPSQAKTPDCAMRSDPRGFGLSTAPSS